MDAGTRHRSPGSEQRTWGLIVIAIARETVGVFAWLDFLLPQDDIKRSR